MDVKFKVSSLPLLFQEESTSNEAECQHFQEWDLVSTILGWYIGNFCMIQKTHSYSR